MASPATKPIDKWQKAIGTALKFTEGNQVDYLVDGWATFEAMNDAIETALFNNDNQYYIYLLGWYCDIDVKLKKNGASLRQVFDKASNQYGIQIRVILWDQLGLQNSGQIDFINSLPTGAGILDNNTQWHWVGAHHQKVLIVKGKQGLIGFCGGVDINSDRIKPDLKKGAPLHDVHCRIIGNGAKLLLDVFIQRWLAHPNHVLLDAEPEIDLLNGEPIINKKNAENASKKGPLIGLNDINIVENLTAKPLGKQYVTIARTFNFITSSVRCAKEHSIKSSLIGSPNGDFPGLIATAKNFIYIEDQYLWNLQAAEVIAKALYHLQLVVILISHTDQVSASMLDMISIPDGGQWAHYNFMKTLKANCKNDDYKKVKVFHKVVKGTNDLGAGTYVHSKCWIFDDEVALIGSANCNRRGWEADSEVAAIVYEEPSDPKTMRSFAQTLRKKLWAEHLGMADDEVKNWLDADKLWPKFGEASKTNSCVKYYDIDFENEPDSAPPIQVDMNKIDPGDGNLASCGNISTIV